MFAKKAFALIELVVVTAILFPVLAQAKGAGGFFDGHAKSMKKLQLNYGRSIRASGAMF